MQSKRRRIYERTELADALDGLWQRAEQRLPHRPVSREAFFERVDDALAASCDHVDRAALDALCAEDLYLACALAAGDPHALANTEAELATAMREAARKIDRAPAFVDDVVQRVRTKLLVGEPDAEPAIAQYRGAAPLTRWVRVVASRVALDLKRAERAQRGAADDLAELPAPDDPELALVWRTCKAEYQRALVDAFAALEPRERVLLRQRHVDGLEIAALGRAYRVHEATAYRWVKKAEERLARTTRDALASRLALTRSQVRSIERVVAENLHISLSGLLRGRNID